MKVTIFSKENIDLKNIMRVYDWSDAFDINSFFNSFKILDTKTPFLLGEGHVAPIDQMHLVMILVIILKVSREFRKSKNQLARNPRAKKISWK